jgi:hypothetical protein
VRSKLLGMKLFRYAVTGGTSLSPFEDVYLSHRKKLAPLAGAFLPRVRSGHGGGERECSSERDHPDGNRQGARGWLNPPFAQPLPPSEADMTPFDFHQKTALVTGGPSPW